MKCFNTLYSAAALALNILIKNAINPTPTKDRELFPVRHILRFRPLNYNYIQFVHNLFLYWDIPIISDMYLLHVLYFFLYISATLTQHFILFLSPSLLSLSFSVTSISLFQSLSITSLSLSFTSSIFFFFIKTVFFW